PGQVCHALFEAEDALLADVVPEVPGERPPRARVRPGADEQPVAAGRVRAVAHDRADVRLVADVQHDRGAQPVGEQQVEAGVDGRDAGRRGEGRDRLAHVVGQGRIAYPADPDR